MEITTRDLKLFRKLNAAGWLTTRQIRNYFFPGKSTNAVCKRLRKLVAGRYVAMSRLSSTEHALYRLSGQGKLVLLKHTQCDEEDITIPKQLPRKIKHFTAVNDLRFCFEEMMEDPAIELLFFFSERELCSYYQNAWDYQDVILSMLRTYKIVPDAVTRIRIKRDGLAREVSLAIEYDGGTEHANFFGQTKVRQYAALFARNYERLGDLKVLTCADSVKRIVSLMRQTVHYRPPRNLFYFASVDKLGQKGWEDTEVFLDPYDFFALVRRGNNTEVAEREIHGEAVPKYTLASLPATSPPSISLRGERERQDNLL